MAELEGLVLPTSCAVTADELPGTRAMPFGKEQATTCEAGTGSPPERGETREAEAASLLERGGARETAVTTSIGPGERGGVLASK